MSNTKANMLLLLASFIWGTAFISQAMGMDYIGPFTFSFARTFLGFLVVLPLAIIFEKNNFVKIFFSKIIANGSTTKKPKNVLAKLNVKGPI
jgi:drug/metabolite transporter (DMT)-like permease